MALILILDDSATNRSIYARLAEVVADGVATEAFADPFDALEWLGHNRVDLVITDFKMPGMDGAAFTRALRALPGGAEVPILVVTAHDDRSFRVRALDAGATDFLQSPIDHFEFVTRARNLLALGRQGAVGLGEPAMEPWRPEALAQLLDTLPALVCATDTEGRCRYANQPFAASLGARPAELVGAITATLLGPARAERSRQADRAVLASGEAQPPYLEELAGPDDAPRRVLTHKTPLRDGAGRVQAVLTTSVEWPPRLGGGG
jgi:PAS domain S-box-containing protein